jgi:hypothetical protein
MLKYKLIKQENTRFYRVKALKDFNNVKAGDLGGFVENEANLSQEGECWIFGNAYVLGDARVYGNARVFGNARVYGNARVFDDAHVYGDARVIGGDWSVSPLYIQGTRHALTLSSPTTITIGCKTRTIEEWLSISDKEIESFDYTDVKEEYMRHIDYIKSNIKFYTKRK